MQTANNKQSPNPCCVPSKERAVLADSSRQTSAGRQRIRSGSIEEMVRLDGGSFLMGTDFADGFPVDGEGPIRRVTLDAVYVDRYPVTNANFAEFTSKTGYRTEAERFGWSFVFRGHIPIEQRSALIEDTVLGAEWWGKVSRADWRHPEGPDSTLENRLHQPVVHVSWNDAHEFASWAGKRLPTEAEWEFASRGGLEQKLFPWGDDLTPNGNHLCNVWQGDFPEVDTAEDGFSAPAPVDAFPPNAYGLYSVTGNTWEWCLDWFHATFHAVGTRLNPAGPERGGSKVMKGGSYLCHRSYCNRYRVAARTSNTPDSSTTNIGFRCVRDL